MELHKLSNSSFWGEIFMAWSPYHENYTWKVLYKSYTNETLKTYVFSCHINNSSVGVSHMFWKTVPSDWFHHTESLVAKSGAKRSPWHNKCNTRCWCRLYLELPFVGLNFGGKRNGKVLQSLVLSPGIIPVGGELEHLGNLPSLAAISSSRVSVWYSGKNR